MRRVFSFWLVLTGWAFPAFGHIGSPNTFFEGEAGPYPVRVMVRSPGVVPGLAEITVRVKEGEAERVSVRPVRWDAGLEGAPPPDPAHPVRGEEGLFAGELWLMTFGSYSVYVDVEGPEGSGTAIVPVNAVATRRLGMAPWLGGGLLGLGVLLFAGAVTIVGAAVRESVLPAGKEPGPGRRRAARWTMAGTTAVLALALYGGKLWWESADRRHRALMDVGLEVEAGIRVEPAGHRTLTLEITDEDWERGRWTPIVPDHGKLMHMFLVREPELDAFAHLHPVKQGDAIFAVDLPSALPAGGYRVYADVTHGSGFAQTLTDAVELAAPRPDAPERSDALAPDPDDSWHVGATRGDAYVFDDGSRLVGEGSGPLPLDDEVELRFRLETAGGEPAPLEPYMGMLSHAALRHEDGSVFTHLHPTGTISMAAQRLFREGSFQRPPAAGDGDGADAAAHGREPAQGGEPTLEGEPAATGHAGHARAAYVGSAGPGTVTLPYAFPKPGPYRLWIQLKSGGRVYTGAFAVEVEAGD